MLSYVNNKFKSYVTIVFLDSITEKYSQNLFMQSKYDIKLHKSNNGAIQMTGEMGGSRFQQWSIQCHQQPDPLKAPPGGECSMLSFVRIGNFVVKNNEEQGMILPLVFSYNQ